MVIIKAKILAQAAICLTGLAFIIHSLKDLHANFPARFYDNFAAERGDGELHIAPSCPEYLVLEA